MRVLAAIVTCIGAISCASAQVFMNVYRCDGKTPLASKDPNTPDVYSDIMVGTRLVLLISSDVRGYWMGGLHLTWDDWQRGKLAGRGFDPNSPDANFKDSCLKAAGPRATVSFMEASDRVGFWLNSSTRAVPGDWFVLDYLAEETGPSHIGWYDYSLSFDTPVKVYSFTHVPSRDFDDDGVVNFKDFVSLASEWRRPVDPNAEPARRRDLDGNLSVGFSDLALFSEYWLERTKCDAAATEGGVSAAGL